MTVCASTADGDEPPLAAARLRYLFVMVHDLDRMLRFYRDDLGLAVEYHDPGHIAFLRFGDAGQSLALHVGRDDAPTRAEHWFAVLDVTDLDGTVGVLRRRGVAVGEVFDVPFGRAAKLRDPEHNVLELHEPARPGAT